jgi:hypothetical protein
MPGRSAPQIGVPHVYPAGYSAEGREEPQAAMLPAGANNDNANVSNFLKYTSQAAALSVAEANRHWVDKGPRGVDMPPGYSQSGERFGRVAGMGTAVVADPSDASGNTVYIGNMGGLWRSTDAGANWTNLTDGKLPRVSVGAVALDPTRPNDIYVGTGISLLTLSGDANGTGIYVSHDRGKTFRRPVQTTQGYGSNAIAVTPTAVFVATNRGLFRSTNHGLSFARVPLPTGNGGNEATGVVSNWISDVVAKANNPNEITAAVGFGLGKFALPDGSTASPHNGLYRSTTGGGPGSFTRMTSGSQLKHFGSSADPLGRIQLAYGRAPGQQDVLWAAVSDGGLAAGRQPAGLDVLTTVGGPSLNPTNTEFNGLYRSGNDGTSWSLKATPQTLNAAPNSLLALFGPLGYGIGVQASYNLWLSTDPNVADQVYLGLEEVFQSTANAGPLPGPAAFMTIQRYADICGFLSYTQNVTTGAACPSVTPIVGGMSTHPDQHSAAAVDTPNGTRLYTGNDGGFFRQDGHALSVPPLQIGFDNKSWTALNTLSTTQPWHVALKPDGETIFGLQDNGSGFTTKDGKSITTCGGDGLYVLPTPDPDVWYCSTPGASLYYTKDHGKNITAIPPGATGASFLSPIAIDPTNPKHLAAAGQALVETDKGTDTRVLYDSVLTGTVVQTDWVTSYDAGISSVKNPATGDPIPWASTAIALRGPVVYNAICAACRGAFTNPKLLNAAIATNAKAGCTPKSKSPACWHRAASKGLPHGWITGIAINPTDTNTIYVTVGQQNLFEFDTSQTGAQKVLVSHDRGETFTDLSSNLPRTEARGIVYRGGKLVVATDVGVFIAPATGGSWSRLGTGLPAVVGRDIYIESTGRYIVVSMFGRGIWQFDFGSTASNSNSPGPKINRPPLATTGLPIALSMLALLCLLAAAAAIRVRRRTLAE